MQALFYEGKKQLVWREVSAPQIKEAGDALVEPVAVSMCDLDHNIVMGGSPFPGPFMLGHEFVGRVVTVGDGVRNLQPGDLVIASFQPSCGHCSSCAATHTSVCREVPNTSMYGIGAAGGDWQGAMSDLVRVPWAEFNLRVIPDELNLISLAPGSDNFADGLRCVEAPLKKFPGASVLIAGQGSIPLYALLCAKHLGAGRVVFASKDQTAIRTAEKLGAEVLHIDTWPKKLGAFQITVDCTNDVAGLQCLIRSTDLFGCLTSASIYFAPTTPIPMADMYMKGIELHTGRADSASLLDRVIELAAGGVDLDLIEPAYFPMADAVDVLLGGGRHNKVIFTRDG